MSGKLDREIDALYHSSNMVGVIQAVRMGIERLETVFRADGGVAKRREVEQIKQYIRENYSDSGMGVDQLAREVGMTPNYLSSIFKKNTGENLSRYLKGFRMERAREMLENTNEKIGIICEKCGFVNVSYFCRKLSASILESARRNTGIRGSKMTSFAARIKKAFSDMKVHRKLIVAYVLTGLFPMCLMFTMFYTQMRRVLVEREIKNLQTTFDQAVDDVNTGLALHQSMSDYLAFDQTIVQIVKAEDKNSFEAYERMVKEFDPMMDSLSYFYPEIRQSTVYVRDFVIPHGTYLRPAREMENDEWTAPADNDVHWYADMDQGTVTLVRSMPLIDDGKGGFLYISMDYSKIFGSMEACSQ